MISVWILLVITSSGIITMNPMGSQKTCLDEQKIMISGTDVSDQSHPQALCVEEKLAIRIMWWKVDHD